MGTKTIVTFFLFLSWANCFSQINTEGYFFEDIPQTNLPIVIDQISFEKISTYMEVEYEKIKDLLKDKEDNFKITTNLSDDKFYIHSKYNFYDKMAVILFYKSPSIYTTYCYLMLYSNKKELLSFEKIGQEYIKNSDSNYIIGLINLNSILKFEQAKSNNFVIDYLNYNPEINYFPFERYDCNENENCLNYKPKLDSIPQRNFLKYNFNSIFFEKDLNLLPLKFCSTKPNSQILSSIGEEKKISIISYFIDSKKIQNGKIIIFFLNEYKYENFKVVKEVGYQIFNVDGSLSKTDQIALYQIDKKGIKSIYSSVISIKNGFLKIESGYSGYQKKTEKFKL